MTVMKESPRTGRTKCYIHEMQRPLELPYKPLQYHICWICQSRLLELAKADFQFRLREQVVTISTAREIQKEEASSKKGFKVKKTNHTQKEIA
ncbi:MAG: hypothetical protein ACE5HS_18850 [bacterium]